MRKNFDQSVKNDLRTCDNIQKIATGQGDHYTTGFLLDYPYYKEHFKMIALDLSEKQALDVDPKSMQQINFTGNLDETGNRTMFFVIEETKKKLLDFLQGTVRVL